MQTIEWSSEKNFVHPFMITMCHKFVYCMVCDCVVHNVPIDFDAHAKGLRHCSQADKYKFYTCPLKNNRYYCLCCDLTIDKPVEVYIHNKSQNHEDRTKLDPTDSTKCPIDWNSSEDFVCAFIAKTGSQKFFCTLCHCWQLSETDFWYHVSQPKHIKLWDYYDSIIKPLKNDYYYCISCNFVFPSYMNIYEHLRGKHHESAQREVSWEFHLIVNPFIYQIKEKEFYCMLCDQLLLEPENHVNKKLHISRLNRDIDCVVPLENHLYRCKGCNCIIPSYKLVYRHIAGKKHRYRMKCKAVEWNSKEDSKKEKKSEIVEDNHESSINENIESQLISNNESDQMKIGNSQLSDQAKITSPPFSDQTKTKHLQFSDQTIITNSQFFEQTKITSSQFFDQTKITSPPFSDQSKITSPSFSDQPKIMNSQFSDQTKITSTPFSDQPKITNSQLSDQPTIKDSQCSHQTKIKNSQISDQTKIKNSQFSDQTKIKNPQLTNQTRIKNSQFSNQAKKSTFQDEELNFPIRLRSSEQSSDNNNSHCNGIKCIYCNSIVKNYNVCARGWEISEEIRFTMKTLNDRSFSASLTCLAEWSKQLTLQSTRDVNDNTESSSVLDSREYFINIPFEESTNVNSIKSESSHSRLTIEDESINENCAIDGKKISADGNLDNEPTVDSGIEDFPLLTSTSTISNENLKLWQIPRKQPMGKIVKFLTYARDIYDTSEIKKILKCSADLIFVMDDEDDYCVVCREIIPNDLYGYLEHITDSHHADNFDKMEYEHILNDDNTENLSSFSLAHEYIEVFPSKESTRCLLCSIEIRRNDIALKEHISEISHREAWQEMQLRREARFEIDESALQCDWYKVLKYKCIPCLKRFDQEINFIDHLESEEHALTSREKFANQDEQLIHGFCAPCGLLWCACADEKIDHCDSPSHQWIAKNRTNTINDLPDFAKRLLSVLKNVDVSKITCANHEVMKEIADSCRNSISNARDNRSKQHCESGNETLIEDIKLMKLFTKRFPLCEKIVSFLNRWLMLCELSGSHHITNHALYWYFIFYLQSVSILPSVSLLHSMKKKDWLEIDDSEDISEDQETRRSVNTFEFKKHLIGFFAFYANFDYRYKVASPFFGGKISKISLAVPHWLAHEIQLNILETNKDELAKNFTFDASMGLQDPFDLQNNLTKNVRKLDLIRFRNYCSKSLAVLTPRI